MSDGSVYIHTTIHILNSIVSKYVLDTLRQRNSGIANGKIHTHDFPLSGGEV